MESRPHVVKTPSQKKYRRTLALIFLTYSVCFGGAMFFILPMIDKEANTRIPSIGIAVVIAVLYGAGMTWFTAQMWHRNGGLETAVLMQGAIRSRRLPPDIDTAEWNLRLAKQETDAVRRRWLYPIIFCGFAGLCLLLALTNPLQGMGFLFWIGVAFFLGLGIYAPFDSERTFRRIRILKSELEKHRPQDPPNPE